MAMASGPVATLEAPCEITASTRLDPAGVSILPSGRLITPEGRSITITHDPFGLAISPDGKMAVALHPGVVTLVPTDTLGAALRFPSYDKTLPAIMPGGASFMGAAFLPDNHTVCLSGGDAGTVVVFDTAARQQVKLIDINGHVGEREYVNSFTGDLAVSRDGHRIFVLDRANYRLVTVEVASGRVVQSVSVGRLPFGLGLSADEKFAYVANVGLYEYPLVPGVTPKNGEEKMLHKPPYGIPSKEAEDGVEDEGRAMPGLGNPLVPEAMSVWVVDLSDGDVVAKLKTGLQIGQMVEGLEVVGGASPNSVVVGERFAYVSNATNDNIAIIDRAKHTIVGHIALRIDPRIDRWRGLMPFGLALSADGRRLYAALLTLNAVAVIDTADRRVLGYLPTGWCPTRLALAPDGRTLYVVTARGYGAGPNGGKDFNTPAQGTYIGDIQLGSLHAIDVSDEKLLAAQTQRVVANTFREVTVMDDNRNPLPPAPGLRKSPIKHIIYVTKENRTFDEVFGEYPGVNGDPTLARFGLKASVPEATKPVVRGTKVTAKNRSRASTVPDAPDSVLRDINVTPNHQKIARQWALSDNFYCDSDASVHGHRWMTGTIPNEWMEANSQHRKQFMPFSPAPGRRFPDSSGGMDPEDYNEIGGMWDNFHRHGVTFFNFGQATEFGGVLEEQNHTDTGIRMPVIFPMVKALFDRTSWTYAGFNMKVPDQYRMDSFEQEVRDRWLSGREPFPQIIAIQIPNDHGSAPRPKTGFPFRHSYMADNDLAIGRFMHFLSRTPWWKDMLVVFVEDDPQGGVDHVDAHRSILMMAGPYVKRGYVSHTHANFGSILKTIYTLLDLPPVNQFDATANPLDDFFTAEPDFSPYNVEPVDKRIFDPEAAMKVYDKSFDWRHIVDGSQLDDPTEQRREHAEQAKSELKP
jgi:DNA-binding beta-propeller fold protein YncE